VQIVLKLSKTEFEKYIFVISSETKFGGSLFNQCYHSFKVQHALKHPSSAFVDLGAPKTGQADNFLEDESIEFPVKSSFKIIIIWASTTSEPSS